MTVSLHPLDSPPSTRPASHAVRGALPPFLFRHPAWMSFSLLLVSASLSAVTLTASAAQGEADPETFASRMITVAFGLATAVAACGTLSGVHAIVVAARSKTRPRLAGIVAALVAAIASGGLTLVTFCMAAMSTEDFRRGRQLRRFGRVLLPAVRAGGAWSSLCFDRLPEDARATAAQWRENGRTEHASVAAFASLTSELLALGAPPALVASANQDALDEIRHTELCFSLACALDGRRESPGPFPEARRPTGLALGRTFGLARLAADSLIDGALHEGVSARVLARRCEIPAVRAMLKEIARDEGRHAAHGWDVVLWCAREGGVAVTNALRTALATLPESMTSPLPAEARDGGWERLGIHGHALEATEYAVTKAELRRRVGALSPAILTPSVGGLPSSFLP